MAYNANNLLPSSYYQMRFELSVTSLTLTGMQISVSNNINDLNSMSISILIISNDYVFKGYIVGFKSVHNNANNYQCTLPTNFATNGSLAIHPFLNGVFLQTSQSNKILNLAYTITAPLISNFKNIKLRVDSSSYENSNSNVTLKILVIKTDSIPA